MSISDEGRIGSNDRDPITALPAVGSSQRVGEAESAISPLCISELPAAFGVYEGGLVGYDECCAEEEGERVQGSAVVWDVGWQGEAEACWTREGSGRARWGVCSSHGGKW